MSLLFSKHSFTTTTKSQVTLKWAYPVHPRKDQGARIISSRVETGEPELEALTRSQQCFNIAAESVRGIPDESEHVPVTYDTRKKTR